MTTKRPLVYNNHANAKMIGWEWNLCGHVYATFSHVFVFFFYLSVTAVLSGIHLSNQGTARVQTKKQMRRIVGNLSENRPEQLQIGPYIFSVFCFFVMQ